MKATRTYKPKIYVVNVKAYEVGLTIGGWITPIDYATYSEFDRAVKRATNACAFRQDKGSLNDGHIAIHDYDYLPSTLELDEYPNMETLYNYCHEKTK